MAYIPFTMQSLNILYHNIKSYSNSFDNENNENDSTISYIFKKLQNVIYFHHDSGSQRKNMRLLQAQVIFRHGARTPIQTIGGRISEADYPSQWMGNLAETVFPFQTVCLDSGRGIHFSNENYGEMRLLGGSHPATLTVVGQEQMIKLGKRIHRHYGRELDLWGYHNDQIFCRSSLLHRSVRSLCCVLAGIYGSKSLKSGGTVTLYTKEHNNEDIYPNFFGCQRIYAMFMRIASEYGKKHEVRRIMSDISNDIGTSSQNCDFLVLKDDIDARIAHGYNVPRRLFNHTDKINRHSAKLLHAMTTGLIESSHEVDMTWLTIGPFLLSIKEEMEKVEQKKPHHKLCLYSSHDSTLAPLLHALGMWDKVWPDFAANIAIELFADEKDHLFVRLKYNDRVRKPNAFGGSEYISFQTFKNGLKPFMATPRRQKAACEEARFPFIFSLEFIRHVPFLKHLYRHKDEINLPSDVKIPVPLIKNKHVYSEDE